MSAEERDVVEAAVATLLADHPPATTPKQQFLEARFDAGLAWVHHGKGFGGLGVSPTLQPWVANTLEVAGAPHPRDNYVGVHQAAAAVHHYAPDDLKRRWLRPAFSNEEYWCQLFSEPGAGSDLAALSTSALRDGEEWVVNGQKVWTSYAHKARWAILLARTDPDVPKHRGLTFFVVDMHAAGIEVRPITTMEGNRHFNEVFLSDVRVPDRYRLGEVGHGWGVSVFMLGAEREGINDHASPAPWLLETWRERRDLGVLEPVARDRVASAYTSIELCRLLGLRLKDLQAGELIPLVKMARNFAEQQTAMTVMDLLGADAMAGGEYDWLDRGVEQNATMRFLRTRASTISGGSVEIMRNILGERVLGLPGERRVDKDLPWSKVPRS